MIQAPRDDRHPDDMTIGSERTARVRTVTMPTSTATYPVITRLHPWWTQAWLTGRRSFDRFRMAACATLMGATLAANFAMAWNTTAARLLLDHRQLVAIVIAVVMLFSLRLSMVTLARSLRYGWMAALPLPAQSGRRTLMLASAALGLLVLAWLASALVGLGIGLGMSAYLSVFGNLLVGVLAASLALAIIALRAWHRPAVSRVRRSTRVPLLSLAWLEHPQVPYLVAWQNRECTRQWRTSGGAKPLGALLLLFPGSPSPWLLFGLIALVVVIAWHRCLLQSCLNVAERVSPLLRQWTLPAGLAARVLARFPLAGSLLAFGSAFAILLTMQPPLLAASAAVLALTFASPITLARLLARFRKLEP